MSDAVFAYASLVSAESASATLGRAVGTLAPTSLRGWRRRWTLSRDNLASEKTFGPADGGEPPRFCLGLNLEEADPADEPPNGALIAVSPEELARLDRREVRYDRLDVTAGIADRPAGVERIFAYTAKPERFAPTPPRGSVILAAYLRAVEGAFDELGEGELEAFRRTTGATPAPVVEGVLLRDEIAPGNPRAW